MWGVLYKFSTEDPVHQNGMCYVGDYANKLRGADKTLHSVFWTKALAMDDSLQQYDWPDRGAVAEFGSFSLQAGKRKECNPPNSILLEESKQKLLCKYKNFSLNYTDFSYETVDKLVTSFVASGCIKMDASPGIPYSTYYTTNKMFLETSIHLVIILVWSRIQLRLKHPDVTDPVQMIELGLCDPVKLFVKEEPHQLNKIREGRVRLIMSVSIVDKLIEMILIKPLKDLEIANWQFIPSKPGMGFTNEMVKTIYDRVHQMKRPVSTDVSGWDWSVAQWLLDADADMTIKLCNNPFEDWENLIRTTATIEGNSVYCLSDSRLFILTVRGNQNSGKLKTSMSNSRMRALVAIIAGCEDCICMGDDDVEEYIEGAVEKYAKMGIKVKIYEEINEEFEFCSKIFRSNSCFPVSYGKTLMKLLHQQPRSWEEYVGYMVGFEDEMRGHPRFAAIMDLIKRTGFVQQGGEQMLCEEEDA